MEIFKSITDDTGRDLYFFYLEDIGEDDDDVARQLDLNLGVYRKLLSKFNGYPEADFGFDFVFCDEENCELCEKFIEDFIE